VLKLDNRLEGDHVTHLKSWIKPFIAHNLVWKCSYVNDTIERGLCYEYHLQWIEIDKRENS